MPIDVGTRFFMSVRRPRPGRVDQAVSRFQATDRLAPPAGDSPTRQRPPVVRTIASAMASPRPGAAGRVGRPMEPIEDPGRARPPGCPGPLSSTVSRDARSVDGDGHVDRAALRARTCRRCRGGRRAGGRAIRADAAMTSPSGGRARSSVQMARLGDRSRTGRRSARPGPPRSTGSASGGRCVASNRASQSRSSSSRRIRLRLAVDRAERRAVPLDRRGPGRGRGSCAPR